MRGPGALTIRLLRQGCANRPFFHIVVAKTRRGPKSHGIELLGSYDPMPNKFGERLCAINFDRVKHWVTMGAQPTRSMDQLLGLAGFFPIHPMTYIEAKRNRAKPSQETEDTDMQQVEAS